MPTLAELIEEAFRRTAERLEKLEQTDPNHELLRYAPFVLEKLHWSDKLSAEFLARFGTPGDRDTLPAKAKYMQAVRRELERRGVPA